MATELASAQSVYQKALEEAERCRTKFDQLSVAVAGLKQEENTTAADLQGIKRKQDTIARNLNETKLEVTRLALKQTELEQEKDQKEAKLVILKERFATIMQFVEETKAALESAKKDEVLRRRELQSAEQEEQKERLALQILEKKIAALNGTKTEMDGVLTAEEAKIQESKKKETESLKRIAELSEKASRVEDEVRKRQEEVDALEWQLLALQKDMGEKLRIQLEIKAAEEAEQIRINIEIAAKKQKADSVRAARDARSADGSVLEYGLDYHLERMLPAIEKGPPREPRFPERDNEWVANATKSQDLLAAWLGWFKSKCGDYEEAGETIKECEVALEKSRKKLEEVKIPLAIQNARLARTADGSVLEYGLQHHLEKFVAALDKGIPGDPRFPERDNEYVVAREKEQQLLVQWLEDFSGKFGQFPEAQETIAECKSALEKFEEKVTSAKGALEVQNYTNAKGTILESGLKHHLEVMNRCLDKGIPGDLRQSNEYVAEREKEQKLLVQWLEGFKSKFGETKDTADTLKQCQEVLAKFEVKVTSAKGKLEVENYINARRADGSVLEYGLKYHLDRMNGALDKGIPGDPRFPERDNEYVVEREKEQKLLVEWLEGFKSKFGETKDTVDTIKQCEEALAKYEEKVVSAKGKLEVQNFVNAKRAEGSVLEYGLKYHLDRMNGALDKGIPGDPRFPERDTEYVVEREKEQKLLVEWLEGLKSKFGETKDTVDTIKQCEEALAKYQEKVVAAKGKLAIQNARNAKRAEGSVLEYGLKHHLDRMNGALDKGIPGDPRFPERDNEYVVAREKEQKLLVEWLEGFKSQFGENADTEETIKECEVALAKFQEKVVAGKAKLAIQNARNAKRAEGSVLEYGLKYHLDRMNGALDKGIPGDPRFPERDNEWVVEREKEQKLLVEWFEGFKSQFGENPDTAETIQECESVLAKYQEKVVAGRAKLAIQNARNARSANGSVLEYGLDYHLERMNGALDKGIPGDPRFPERDNEWVVAREKEQKLLVEWLENFRSQLGETPDTMPTINECQSALDKFQEKVVAGKAKLAIQNARNAKRAEGSVLEYGLKYHLERMVPALEKGIPGDPRFPERDNEWIEARVKEQKLLVEWLEDFKSKFEGNKDAEETINECQAALDKYQEKVESVRIPLAVQTARNAKRAEGSTLEYGLKYHLDRMNGALDKGIPGDPRFPERDNQWIAERVKEQKLLVEWFEDFKSKFGQYKEADQTSEECQSALDKFQEKVEKVRIPLEIQNARNAKRAEGSILEYGLKYHLEKFNGALDKGIPGDPRFPERDTEWVEARTKEQKLLVEWLEDFKSKYGEHREADDTIYECQQALEKYQEKVEAGRAKLLVQNARNAKRAEGSCLEYGLKYHLERMNGALDKGIPGDPRFPERDNEWITEREKEQKLLVEWLEDFKSKLGEHKEAEETINECQQALDKYKEKVESVRAKLLIQNARNARSADGSVLEYGLQYHLERMVPALEKGIPGDPRFPERDNEWIEARIKEQKLLVEWLEDFKSKVGSYPEAVATIDECQAALDKYQEKVESVRIPLAVQNARNAKRAEGSILEYGLKYHLERMNGALDKGIPGDPRFPERDNEWITEREKEQKLLVEWLEDFKSKLGEYKEARDTINECQQALDKYKEKVETVRIKLLVQTARNAKRAEGSVLEYGLKYHLERMIPALDKGIPGDPRFPERDNEWIEARVKEQKLLVEWLEDFKSKLGAYPEAVETLTECRAALDKYQEKVESVRIPLAVQNARNAKRAEGSVLEYGLKYHLERMNGALDKGVPGDPRFPERDNEWVEERTKEQKLLVEWLEDFKSKLGEHKEAYETIEECQQALDKYKEKVESVRIKLAIQNARNAKRAEGSCLEYGLKHHLENMNKALDKGIPGDPRFPERDNEWIEARVKEQKILVEWLEDFMSKLGEYDEALETVAECRDALQKYEEKVESVRIPLAIQNARNAKRAEGSCLEYGLKYHTERMQAALEKGIPGDPRFPERDNEWIEARGKEQKLLVEWVEDFKGKFGSYDEALPTIDECQALLDLYVEKVESVRIPLSIQNARNAKRAEGSVLEYGLKFHLERMNGALDKGIPGDPRFPERDNEWIVEREKEQKLLVEWLEDFKSKFEEHKEARETIKECETTLEKYQEKVEAVRIPLEIQTARNAKRAEGSTLEYGLKYHLEKFNGALDKGVPGDPRFPERDNEWVTARVAEQKLLVEWLEDFKSKFGHYTEAVPTLDECQVALDKYQEKVETVRIPLAIQTARNAKRAEGSTLEYGLKYHLENMNKALDKGVPGDPRFPERDNEWIDARVKEQKLLVEWFEDFKCKFEQYKEAKETIDECEQALDKYQEKVETVRIPLAIQNARNAKRAEGSSLEYGLKHHLEKMNGALDKGIPGDPRFPERDNEWVEGRVAEQKLLVEWLEDFKSNWGGYKESLPTLEECQVALDKYQEKVETVRIPLAVQNARNAKRAEGSVLEYGLQHHLERMNKALDNGIPNDPRFPERDNEWITEREKEQKLLVEWLEDFKSKLGQYKESYATIDECNVVLDKYQEKVEKVRIPLAVQNARNAKRAEGSVLEYGLQHHLERMIGALDKGIPGDPRFPERDNEWIAEREKEQKLLVEWLEDFKSKFGQYSESATTTAECVAALDKYREMYEKVKIPLEVKNARNAKREQGSVLEYGLEHHLTNFNASLAKGMPNDPRFPERDNEWVASLEKEQKLICEWLEDFKSKLGEYKEAWPTIDEVSEALAKYQDMVDSVKKPLMVRNARNAKRAEGSILEFGLDHHLSGMKNALEKGMPNDPRFPERDNEWLEQRTKEEKLLVEWLEDFKSKFGEMQEGQATIEECYSVLAIYHEKTSAVKIPLLIRNARNAKRAEGSILEFGLEHHLSGMNSAMDKGLPNDPRFPERDNEWVQARTKEHVLLVEWLEDFKSKYSQYEKEAQETLDQCQAAIAKYQEKVGSLKNLMDVKNARNAKRAEGSVLEYGLEHHLKGMKTGIEAGLPGDPRFPERDNEWLEARLKEQKLLVEWFEEFQSKLGHLPEAKETLENCEEILALFNDKVEKVRIPLLIQNAVNARKEQGSALEFGLTHHLKGMNEALDKGLPNDPRFPERDNEWVDARTKEQKLLVEWLEDFKSKLGEHEQAQKVIDEVYATLAKYKTAVETVRIPLAIKNARLAKRNEGSVLEYGFENHLKRMDEVLEKGIPGDPRFPERDNKWVEERVKEKKLLVEWMSTFEQNFGQYPEAAPTLEECNKVLEKYQEKVEKTRRKLEVQNAVNAKKAEGSVLEFGLDHHNKRLRGKLDKGLPNNPRFPERDNEWVTECTKDKELLVEWLSDFESKFSLYEESTDVILQCRELIELYQTVVGAVKLPLEVKNARNARKSNGSVLEFGLDHHLEKFNDLLTKGPAKDPRFPERDNAWTESANQFQKLLVEWLEGFKGKFEGQQEPLIDQTIDECEQALYKFKEVAGPIKALLEVQNHLNLKKADGGLLEYGFEHHITRFQEALDKGLPNSPTPSSALEIHLKWLEERTTESRQLIEWLEDFKSKFGENQQPKALEAIARSDKVLAQWRELEDKHRVPVEIRKARAARKPTGQTEGASSLWLEFGLDHHLETMNKALDKGLPGDPRFPERDNQWVEARTKEQQKLVEWLAEFEERYGLFDEAKETIGECQAALDKYKEKVLSVKIPLDIQNARNARKADGSVLEYGLEHHLKRFLEALEKGNPGDPRFPERDNDWMKERKEEHKLLVEWLESFKSKFGELKEAEATIHECDEALWKYKQAIVLSGLEPKLQIQNARNARQADGSALEYGLAAHLEKMKKALDAGLPNQDRFPERDVQWVEQREVEYKLLSEWLSDFQSKYGVDGFALETVVECEGMLGRCKEVLSSVKVPLGIKAARLDRGVLEFGLDFHLNKMRTSLEKGPPQDTRFPERDRDWVQQAEKDKTALVEWLSAFSQNFSDLLQSGNLLVKEIVDECEAVLTKYSEVVDKHRIPIEIKKAVNARRADGSVLEFGLDHHLKNFNTALDAGIPGNPRFPERDNEWLEQRAEENKLLIEWLEEFRGTYEKYEEAKEVIERCETTLYKHQQMIAKVKIPLAIQNAVNAKKKETLEFGLEHHLKGFQDKLDKGPPQDPRFPERDNEWFDKVETDSKLLLEWLEDFRCNFGEYDLAQPIIDRCEKLLTRSKTMLSTLKVPQLIKNARNARRADGSVLEFGLEHHLKNLNAELAKGLPNNPRFPERDNEWVKLRTAEKQLLVEWLANFSSNFAQYPEAKETIDECEATLDKFTKAIDTIRIPLEINNAKNSGTVCGVSLGHSLEHHLTIMGGELEKGLPSDPRFPERDVEWLKKRAAEFKALGDWFEQFRSVFGEYTQASETLDAVELLLVKYKKVVAPLQLKTEIQQAINARKNAENPAGILEYGLDFHLKQMTDSLDKGLPNDKRFPERDNEWISKLSAQQTLLIDWVSNFTCTFSAHADHELVSSTIEQCEGVLARYKAEVGKVKIPLDIKNARNARRANGSVLEFGLDHHLTTATEALSKDPPKDERFPERLEQWIEARTKEKRLLVEWFADFNATFGHLTEAQETQKECEALLQKFKSVVEPLLIPLEVDKACRAKKAESSVLEYGLDYHLKRFSEGLEKGLPNDPRFPERDAEWVEERSKEYNLLVEWLEGFRAKFGEHEETFAKEPIQKSEALLKKYKETVEKVRLPLEIKKFRLARNLLEYGFEHHLKNMHTALDAGAPNDERFPEKKKKWVNERNTEYSKLVEWYSQFSSQFGEEDKEVKETVDSCNDVFAKYKKTVVVLKDELEIEDAVNARKADGSVLEYGLKFHLKKMTSRLAEEVPTAAQPASEWMKEREDEKKLLVEWLSGFSAKFGDLALAKPIVAECDAALQLYSGKVEPLKLPIDIAKFKEGRKRNPDSVLEFGLDFHLERMSKALAAGPPNDARFPERDLVWMEGCQKDRNLLVEWLEEFRSQFSGPSGLYEQANATAKSCEDILAKYKTVVASKKLPIDVQTARNARKADGSVLEYGLDFQIKKLRTFLSTEGADVSSDSFKTDLKQLVEWLEEFRSSFVEYSEEKPVKTTVEEVEGVISLCKKTISERVVPLAVKKAIEARGPQSGLEYGFHYHLKSLDRQLEGSRATLDVKKIDAEYRQVVQWFCQFKSDFTDHLEFKDAAEVVKDTEAVLFKYQKIIGGARTQQKLKEALEDRSRLPYGVKWSLEQYHKCIGSLPPSPSVAAGSLLVTGSSCTLAGMTSKLIEWVEVFKTEFEFVPEAQETIKVVEAALEKCRSRFPAVFKNAASSRKDDSGAAEEEDDVQAAPGEAGPAADKQKKAKAKTNFVLTEEEFIPKREEAARTNDKEEPPFVEDVPEKPTQSEILDPAPDRKFPDDLEFAKAVMQEVEKKEKSFQQSVGKAVVLALDWEFTDSSTFKGLSGDEQKKVGMALAYSLLSKVALSDDGLTGICSDKVGKIVVLEKISRVCVGLDAKNSITAPGGYEIKLKGVSLEVVVNFKEYSSSFSSITSTLKKTLETLLDLPIRRALDNVQLQVKAMMGALQNVMERKGRICIRLDMKFMDHPNFKKEKTEVQVDIIKALINHAKRLLINGNGDSLAEVCSAQPVVKREAFRKLSVIIVTFDPENMQKVYSVVLSGNDLLCTVDMEIWSKVANIKEVVDKFDESLGTINAKAVELAKPKLRGYESMMERKIGVNALVHVDWSQWVNHPKYLRHPVKVQAAINEAILNKILNEVLNGEDGFCELYARSDGKVQTFIKQKIKKISVAFDPEDTIADGKRETITFKDIRKPAKKKPAGADDAWEEMLKQQKKEMKENRAALGLPSGSKNVSQVNTPRHFRAWLDYSHCTLHLIGNMASYRPKDSLTSKLWTETDTKLGPLFRAAAVRLIVSKKILESATWLSNYVAEKKLPIIVDFESFIDSWTFLGLSEHRKETVLHRVHDVHVKHLTKMFDKVCAHELGKKAVQEQVKECRLTVSMRGNGIQVSLKDGIWLVTIAYQLLSNPGAGNWHAWQLRWALGVSIPIFKDLGVKLMDAYMTVTKKTCEADLKLDFDWEFIDRPEFLAQDPQKIVRTIKNATRNFSKGVLHNGLNKVATHPVGKECIQKEIKTIRLKFDPIVSDATLSPSKHSRNDSKIEVQGDVLYICCNPDTLEQACKSRYKERIEFEYNLIVAIARSNAMKTFEAALAMLREKSQYSTVEMTATHENFVLLPSFRIDLAPPDQADIITSLYALTPMAFIQQIVTAFGHQLVRDTFKAKVKTINFKVDPDNKTNGFPSTNRSQETHYRHEPAFTWNEQEKALDVLINLNYVLRADKLIDWRVRFLDILDILVPIACDETANEHNQIITELHAALTHNHPQGKKWPVVVDWKAFTKDEAFVGYHPHEQWGMVQAGNVKMLRTTLIGNDAFSPPKGLCEFVATIEKMNESIDNIRFFVDTKGTPKYVQLDGKTLVVTYPLLQLLREEFRGCHYPIEDLLQLRNTKQVACIKRAMERIVNDTRPLTTPPTPIEVNWGDFADALPQSSYIQTIDTVAKIPGTALIGDRYDWGDIGLNTMFNSSNSLRSAFQAVKTIHFSLDPENNTKKHIGNSRGLNPRNYVLSLNGSTLTIALNLNTNPSQLCRVGRVAQFFFCSSEAISQEAQEVRNRAEQMRLDEENRRRQEMERAQEENRRITQENQREQENYNKAMADWNKEINERCNYSQCSAGYNKCGVCNGRGHNTNNNHTSPCSSCSGQGKRKCQSCDGTMKKYPNGKSQPNQPRFREQQPLPTFGAMPNYESMI